MTSTLVFWPFRSETFNETATDCFDKREVVADTLIRMRDASEDGALTALTFALLPDTTVAEKRLARF